MAQQTSAIQRKQTTPRPIGRLMDADVSWSILLRFIEIRSTLARWNGTCVTAVKGILVVVSNRNQRHGSQSLELKRTLWKSYRTLVEPSR